MKQHIINRVLVSLLLFFLYWIFGGDFHRGLDLGCTAWAVLIIWIGAHDE